MIRKASVLFCDNEHGFSDVCFTGFESGDLTDAELYVNPSPLANSSAGQKKLVGGLAAAINYARTV